MGFWVIAWSEAETFFQKKGLPVPESVYSPHCGAFFSWLISAEGHSHFFMVLPDECNDSFLYHEALHAAFILLDECGVDCTADNHEMLTYHQTHIVETVKLKFYKIKPPKASKNEGKDQQEVSDEGEEKPSGVGVRGGIRSRPRRKGIRDLRQPRVGSQPW